MKNIYPLNGLPFWDEAEILEREHLTRMFSFHIVDFLRAENAAWHAHRIEAPMLTPANIINPNYTDQDCFFTSDKLVMRPETTPGSYAYARWLLDNQKDKPPLIVWQAGKSYRREQDQTTKNMRLKEFWQLEFQCVYADDTKNDYMAAILPKLVEAFTSLIGRKCRKVVSDRLPSYSRKTMDIEAELPWVPYPGATVDQSMQSRWMEMASISLRNDFPGEFTYTTSKGANSKKLLVLEVAIGLDRCVYAKFLPHVEDTVSETPQ
jgi:glycyl-tRNA synthetase